jgi:thioredoxin 1
MRSYFTLLISHTISTEKKILLQNFLLSEKVRFAILFRKIYYLESALQYITGGKMGVHIDTTDADFENDIDEKDKLVIVDLWAEWCGPCKMMEPVLTEIAEEFKENVKLVKLNIDENQKTAADYNVMNIPTLILFKEGKEVDRLIGALPKNQLAKRIGQYV